MNVDENTNSAGQFNIRGIPTLLIFKGGQVAEQGCRRGPSRRLQIEKAVQRQFLARKLTMPERTGAGKPQLSRRRCHWAQSDVMVRYHDEEWGVPVHEDLRLFEFLILEGAQAGLSWETVLRKRERYREAVDGCDVSIISKYDDFKNPARYSPIRASIRNRLKISSTISNAQAFSKCSANSGTFDVYIWQFTGGNRCGSRGADRKTFPRAHLNPTP